MEKVIYGPKGEVARRVVMAGGHTQATIYRDPDDKKLLVHHVFDAGPTLEMAHAVRSITGPWSKQKNFRLKCLLPPHIYYQLKRDAMKIAGQTGESANDVWRRLRDNFLEENPRFKT